MTFIRSENEILDGKYTKNTLKKISRMKGSSKEILAEVDVKNIGNYFAPKADALSIASNKYKIVKDWTINQ